MKITFFSNILVHHQIPFSDEMYQLMKDDYKFISTQDDTERKKLGWESFIPAYEINSSKNSEAFQEAVRLADESDVIILGSAPGIFIREFMENRPEGLAFVYSERIYKRGKWCLLTPRILMLIDTYLRYRSRKLFALCASAYTSSDLSFLGLYSSRCYKWGYFPETYYYDLNELMRNKSKPTIQLLWCGRLLKLKHPNAAIKIAQLLKQEGFDFHLSIIGFGEEEDKIEAMISKYDLETNISLLGMLSPGQVRSKMEEADIFLFTSDFHEGFGAVVSEAMNSGCAVVASHAAGSVPYLIKDGINGIIYRSGDLKSLHHKVKQLIIDKDLRENLGRNAYETIVHEWNAKEAVRRLLLLIEDLNNKGSSDRFQSGPCSKAEIIKNSWFPNSRKNTK